MNPMQELPMNVSQDAYAKTQINMIGSLRRCSRKRVMHMNFSSKLLFVWRRHRAWLRIACRAHDMIDSALASILPFVLAPVTRTFLLFWFGRSLFCAPFLLQLLKRFFLGALFPVSSPASYDVVTLLLPTIQVLLDLAGEETGRGVIFRWWQSSCVLKSLCQRHDIPV